MVRVFTCTFNLNWVYSLLAYAFNFVVFQSDYTKAYTYLDSNVDAGDMSTFTEAKLESRDIDQITAEAIQVCMFVHVCVRV